MEAFLTVEKAKKKIEDSKKYILLLQEFIDLSEKYEPESLEQLVTKSYAETGNVAIVAKMINEAGYRFENRRKYTSNDITEIIKGLKPTDRLQEIIKDIQKKNLMKARKSW